MTVELDEILEKGNTLLQLNHFISDGKEVELDIEESTLPYIHEEIDLLYPMKHHVRDLVYMYIQELIDLLPALKAEGKIDRGLLSVVETLLLGLDYVTHESFFNEYFKEEQRNDLKNILKDCFKEHKNHTFTTDANRPTLLKSNIIQEEGKIYAIDSREKLTRLYMAVFYKKSDSIMERFKQVGDWLGKMDLKVERGGVPYEDMVKGMTKDQLHDDLIYYLNMVKRTFSFLINTTSWRSNELLVFDEIDICSKLGIR